ncbi:HlyD family secretion protein [Caldanaerovirga acetigignens]|uniref:HlyD family secretion protein n=1 Tax=Caldanaerovirga acetigignens TaxID=447595 RepID=A0A1M7HKJ1_9FIRM|nr:efflux RND transporter periplasmic adaptor subunit [Caldanaerovirga acetigignens]SHM28853.1 HlyD family secretion protein [Caldanaerovirga acetigignens]
MKWKFFAFSAILILILALVFYEKNRAIEVEIIEIQPVTLAKTIKEVGKIVPKVEYTIQSVVAGKIIRMYVEEGHEVKTGQVLAEVDSKELEFQLKQLQAELKVLKAQEALSFRKPLDSEVKTQELQVEEAKKDFEAQESEFKRIKELYSQGAVTLKEYESIKNMLEKAKINLQRQQEALKLLYESRNPTEESRTYYAGRIEALEAQIDLLKYKIERCKVTSPIDGIVAELSTKLQDVVSPGTKFMKIFKSGEYLLEVFIPADFAPNINPGMEVKLIQGTNGKELISKGVVEKIAPSAVEKISALGIEEQRIKVTVKPFTAETSKLIPGMVIDVEFTIQEKKEVLAVPKTSLFPYGDGDAVWTVEHGRAKIMPVKTGFESDNFVVIEEGLKEKDLVILNPQTPGLKEGRKIRLKLAKLEI